MNKSLGNGTKKFLENAKKILNSRGARLTYVVIIIVVILLSLTYGIMSITGQFKDKCPKDQSPQGPDQKCFNDECNQKTDDTCQDEIIGSKLQWDTANRPDCPDCGCDDGYSIVKKYNGNPLDTCVKMCGTDKFPNGGNQNEYVCAYVDRPKHSDDDDKYLKYIQAGIACEGITFNGRPLYCSSNDFKCSWDGRQKDKGYCSRKSGPAGKSCPTGENSFCLGNKPGDPCGKDKGKCEAIPLLENERKPRATYCSGTTLNDDGQLCCDPKLMTLTNKGEKGCCKQDETPVDVKKPGNEKSDGCCHKNQTVSSNGICCEQGQKGTDDGECCDENRIVKGSNDDTFCCDSKSLQSENNLQPILNSSNGKIICSLIGKSTPFNVKKSECNSTKETFNNSPFNNSPFNNNYISMNDNNSPFNNNYISMNDNNSPFNNNYSRFNNNYSENAYDNYGKENFGSPFPLEGANCQFKNPQTDTNINLVCEDDKCRLACGNYDPSITNDYKLNSTGKLDYCKRVDCQIDGNLIYTPNKSDGNVICTDGKGNYYWKHPNPGEVSFTLTGNMGKTCTEQDCFNIFDSISGLEVDYSKIEHENGQCILSSNCKLLRDFGTETVPIASQYSLNGIITKNDKDCIENRGSCKYLHSGRFCAAGSLDGEYCLEEKGTQNSVKACPKAVDQKIGFPFNIKCEQPSINNPKRRFYCKTTDGVEVNSGFGNGCCSFGNIVIAKDIHDVSALACQKGYFGAYTSVPINWMFGNPAWNEGRKLNVLKTGPPGHTDSAPSRNLIILKNIKTGNYLNINDHDFLCETDDSKPLHLYYINNAGTETKFGIYEVKFAGKQGVNPHSFLAGQPMSGSTQIRGVVSNNNNPSKRGDIGFLTVNNGGGNPHDFPIRLVIDPHRQTKCVLAAYHISNQNGGSPFFLQNGLNDAVCPQNYCIRLGRVESDKRIRFNVYWNTKDKGNHLAYPNRRLTGGSGPDHEYWDLSASAEYEIVAALREGEDDFMVNQFRGKLPTGPNITEPYTIKDLIEGTHMIKDIIHVLQNNIQPSAK